MLVYAVMYVIEFFSISVNERDVYNHGHFFRRTETGQISNNRFDTIIKWNYESDKLFQLYQHVFRFYYSMK